jgi:hypothetical protein
LAGHAGKPPPAAIVTDEGALNTTRWYADRAPPKPVAVTTFELSVVTAVPATAVVTRKEFAAGATTYSTADNRDAALVGQAAVGVKPDPVIAVGAGAVKNTTWPAKRVPTEADTTLPVIPVTGTAEGKVDTLKLFAAGAAVYRTAPAIAAAVAGHAVIPPPVSVVVLPDCVKKSSAPAGSVPTAAVIAWVVVEMAVTDTPDTPVPTTQ